VSTPADPSSLPPLAYGVASASYQIEGAVAEDGRGVSIWDTFSAEPGRVRGGDDGTLACDSYHRLDDDVALVRGLGVDAYRFSIAWPRVMPEGTGRIETRGLDYYERLVDALLEADVEPAVTLYHWDLPQALEDRGGWLDRGTAEAFADYAAVVHDRLGDRVSSWATHNEPWCAAYLGYAAGVHAPGRREGEAGHRAAHHLLLGHALVRQALPDAHLGIVLNLAPVWAETADAEEVADGVDAIRNRVWLDPLVDGAYDERLLAVAPVLADPDLVRPGDLEAMRGSIDWLGINYYTPIRPAVFTGGESRTPSRVPSPVCRPSTWSSASRARTSAGRSSRAGSRSCWSRPTGGWASRWSSPRTVPRWPTPTSWTGSCRTTTASPTSRTTSRPSTGRAAPGRTSAATSPGP